MTQCGQKPQSCHLRVALVLMLYYSKRNVMSTPSHLVIPDGFFQIQISNGTDPPQGDTPQMINLYWDH